MSPEPVLPGVYDISMLYVHAFLISDEEVTLVDSGLSGRSEKFLKTLFALGRQATDLKHILITHHHVDHTGSLAALVKATGAKVYIHPLDAPLVRGERPMPTANRATLSGRTLGPVVDRFFHPRLETVQTLDEVGDGEELPIAGGITVIHSPGHTAGHLAYLWPRNRGVLFAGDAAGNMFGRVGAPLGMFTEDMAQARESMRKLAALEFASACFGHSGVIKGKAHTAFRRAVERMAR